MAASPRAALPAPGPRGRSPGEAPARSDPIRGAARSCGSPSPRRGAPGDRGDAASAAPHERHRVGNHDAPRPQRSPCFLARSAAALRRRRGGEAQIGEPRLPPLLLPFPGGSAAPSGRPPAAASPRPAARAILEAHTRARPRSLAHTHGARFPPEPTARPGPQQGGGGGGEAARRSHGPAAPQVTEGRGEGGSAAPRAPAPLTRRALGAPGALIVAFIPGGFGFSGGRAREKRGRKKEKESKKKKKIIKEKTPRASPFPPPAPIVRPREAGRWASAAPGCHSRLLPAAPSTPRLSQQLQGWGDPPPPAPTNKELRESWTESRAPVHSATLGTQPRCSPRRGRAPSAPLGAAPAQRSQPRPPPHARRGRPPRIRRGRWEILITDAFILHNCG